MGQINGKRRHHSIDNLDEICDCDVYANNGSNRHGPGGDDDDDEDIHLPDEVNTLIRQARNISEIAFLTYDEFIQNIHVLNQLTKKSLSSSDKQLIFAIKKGTDQTMLWKGTVQIACVKIDRNSRKVESYRLLNLHQFLRVFWGLKYKLNAIEQSSHQLSTNKKCKHAMPSSSSDTTAIPSCSNGETSTSNGGSGGGDESVKTPTSIFEPTKLIEEFDSLSKLEMESDSYQSDCCICLERKPEVLLPCAHCYCLPCIEQWNVKHKTCPLCREILSSTNDTWILSEAPDIDDINEEISSTLNDLAGGIIPHSSSSTSTSSGTSNTCSSSTTTSS